MNENILVFKQSRGYCGPAALKMAISKFGLYRSEKYLARLSKADKINGTTDVNIVNTVKKLGLYGFYKRKSSIKEIRENTRKGIPVIVDWFSPETGGHYSVVVGFKKEKIMIADPHYGQIKKYDIDWFKERWFDVIDDKLILREMIIINEKISKK